jgi:hypothetical protein
MHRMGKTHKLYCYVDETGQDTKGHIYVVVAILTIEPNELSERLVSIETSSGKGKVKWHRARHSKEDYINQTLSLKLNFNVYYQVFSGSELSFELATVQATANAINTFCRQKEIENYKATVVIDGLHRSLQHRTGKLLRNLGIRTKSVRGERDETNPMIRMADALAGVVREAHEGNTHFSKVKEELERQGIMHELY